jgi:hypothetical protein
VALRTKEVDAMWTKLGFDITPGKHVFATLTVDGVIVVRTKRSHGAGKLDGHVPHFIRQKMYLTEGQFKDAYDCPMKAPEYHAILKEKGKLGIGRP